MTVPCDVKIPCHGSPDNFSAKALWHTPWRPSPRPFRLNKRQLRARRNSITSKPQRKENNNAINESE